MIGQTSCLPLHADVVGAVGHVCAHLAQPHSLFSDISCHFLAIFSVEMLIGDASHPDEVRHPLLPTHTPIAAIHFAKGYLLKGFGDTGGAPAQFALYLSVPNGESKRSTLNTRPLLS